MDNQDQRRTQTAGHESHGVHVCHKCGWSFPNPHPSAKHRRAHKKICGTIEGYKLSVTEGQTQLNGSDDEHVSDDDHKTPGLVSSGPSALDKGNNEKGNDGTGEKSIRSEDEVFSDAITEFSDSGQSPGIKEPLREDILESRVEKVDIKEPKFSGSSEDKDLNAADASQLLVKSSDDCKLQNPNSLQSENVEVGNALELQDQLAGSSSITDLRTEDATIVHSDDSFGLSIDSLPSKAEAMADVLAEKDTYAGENVAEGSLISVVKEETNLKGKDAINSDRYAVEMVDSSDNVVVETREGLSKTAVNVVSLDHQVGVGAANLEGKDEINSDRDAVEIVDSSDNVAGETHGVSKMEVSDVVVSLDHKVGNGAANLKGKDEIKSDRDMVEIVDSSDNVVIETREGLSKIADSDVVSLDRQVDDEPANLEGKDEINSDRDLVETVDSSDNVVEKHEELSKITVIDVVSLDHQGVDGTANLKGKDEINSDRDLVEIVDSSDNVVVEKCQSVIDVSLDHQVGDGAPNLKHEDGAEFLSSLPEDNLPLELNLAVMTNDAQVVSAHVVQFSSSSDVKILQEKGEGNTNVDPLTTSDDRTDVAHPESEYEAFKDCEEVLSQNSFSLHSSESLKHEEDDLKEVVTEENNFHFSTIQMSEKSESTPEDKYTEEITVSPIKLTVESSQRSDEIAASMNADENPVVHFSEEKGSLSKESLMASSNESHKDSSFGSSAGETSSVINIDNISHLEKNRTEIKDVAIDGMVTGANVENDIEITFRDVQPSVLFQSEVKQLNDSLQSDDAGELGKTEQCDTPSPKSSSSHFEIPGISEVAIGGPQRKSNGTEFKLNEEHNKSAGTSADSHQAESSESSMKAVQDLIKKYTSLSSLNTEPSSQHAAAGAEDNQSGERGKEVSGITAVPASVDSGSRCDSLEGNWGSVSVLSMQSDAPAVTDAETLPSTGLLTSTEAGKSNLNNPKPISERQNSGKSEMFEPPSFMTLVEPKHADSPNAAASAGQNSQHSNPPSQAAWFPTLTQVANESQGRKKNEEIIAKVTSWSTSKEHTPLKSLLGEAASSNKPKSPRMEESSSSKKNGKAPENNGFGLATVNSILGPESPASSQVVKSEVAKEWNSPARYPADIKREKRKSKSRPYWIHLVCCSAVDHQRR